MLIFLQAVFIAVILLYTSNIWVTFIPNPTVTLFMIGLSVLLLALMTARFSLRKPPRGAVLALMIVLLTQFALSIGSEAGSVRPALIVGYAFLTVLCLVIMSRWNEDQERYSIKVFIVISSIMSFLGFAAWMIVTFDWMSQQQIDTTYFIDIDQFTDGKINRIEEDIERANQFGIYENTYSFPYSLGLVLTSSYLYDFFGFQFFRASGWYNEPVAIWFMIIPVFVLTLFNSYFSKTSRIILLTTQLLFLLASFSLSIIIGLIFICILRKLLYLSAHGSLLKSVVFAVAAATVVGLLGVYAFYYVPESALALNILFSKFAGTDYIFVALDTLIDPVFILAYFYFFITALVSSWKAAKENNDLLVSFSLIVLCFLIVALKGAFLHLLISPAFYILFVLMLRHLNSRSSVRRVGASNWRVPNGNSFIGTQKPLGMT